MKNNIKNIIIILFISLGFIGCSDFLDENPPTVISQEVFYKTEQDARNAADGIYERMRHVYSRRWMCIDLYTDDVVSKNSTNTWTTPMAKHTITPSFELFGDDRDVYIDWWIGISRANDVIHYVSLMEEIDETYKNSIVGEAKALRAFFYYNLVRAYGDMPLITSIISSEADFRKQRVSVDEVYNQIIIPDLLFASENCGTGFNDGHITKWSAKLILSEVYLTRAGWRRTSDGVFVEGVDDNEDYYLLAKEMALEVINDSPHSLNLLPSTTTPACGTAWDSNNPFSNESILEISYLPIENLGNWMSREGRGSNDGSKYWGSNKNTVPDITLIDGSQNTFTIDELAFPRTNNAGVFLPAPDLYEAYEDADERRNFNILTRYDNSATNETFLAQPMFRKFVDMDVLTDVEGTSFQYADNNTILFRYADALLIYAEASNEIAHSTDGYSELNQIRERAGIDPIVAGSLDQESFRDSVLVERRRELAGEYKRKFDLIRTNRLTSCTNPVATTWDEEHGSDSPLTSAVDNNFTGAIDWPDHEWLWPIPQNQIELNQESNWIQNAGY